MAKKSGKKGGSCYQVAQDREQFRRQRDYYSNLSKKAENQSYTNLLIGALAGFIIAKFVKAGN